MNKNNIDVIGLGEAAVSMEADSSIKTYSLGSCVAVCFWVPKFSIGAMIHVVLPTQCLYGENTSNRSVYYYADTAIPSMLKQLNEYGVKYNTDIIIKLVGGAEILEVIENKIGIKNILATKKSLWRFRMGVIAEDIGGKISRTVTLNVNDGSVLVSSPNREQFLL